MSYYYNLCEKHIKKKFGANEQKTRDAWGTVGSLTGIVVNFLLAAIKLVAGMLSGSVAAVADAANNLSDAGGSFISLLAVRLSARRETENNPFGFGRMEYLGTLGLGLLILFMGVELFKSGVAGIMHPEAVVFSVFTLVMLCVSVLGKLWLYVIYRKIALPIKNSALLAAAQDSLSDCAATGMVLLCTLLYRLRGLQLDGWGGLTVGIFVLLAGLRALSETVNTILGRKPNDTLVESIRALTMTHPEILGVHDIVVHDYGPGRLMASLHAEVSADSDLMALHSAVEHIEDELETTLGCRTVIHMDPVQPDDEHAAELRRLIRGILYGIDPRLSIHDFRIGEYEGEHILSFDVDAPYALSLSDEELRERISRAVDLVQPCRLTVRIDRCE